VLALTCAAAEDTPNPKPQIANHVCRSRIDPNRNPRRNPQILPPQARKKAEEADEQRHKALEQLLQVLQKSEEEAGVRLGLL
jgi:hypothetical protein